MFYTLHNVFLSSHLPYYRTEPRFPESPSRLKRRLLFSLGLKEDHCSSIFPIDIIIEGQ